MTDVLKLYFVIQRADVFFKQKLPWVSRSTSHNNFRNTLKKQGPTVEMEIIDMAREMGDFIEKDTNVPMDPFLKELLLPSMVSARADT